jgi:hypothetical protein
VRLPARDVLAAGHEVEDIVGGEIEPLLELALVEQPSGPRRARSVFTGSPPAGCCCYEGCSSGRMRDALRLDENRGVDKIIPSVTNNHIALTNGPLVNWLEMPGAT